MRVVRAGLGLLAVVETAVGLWTLFLPRSFYDIVPGVDAEPFNEHLTRGAQVANSSVSPPRV